MPTLSRLREWRTRRLLSQRSLAKLADVAPASVVRAEKGEPIHFQTAKRLADALKVEPEELVGADALAQS